MKFLRRDSVLAEINAIRLNKLPKLRCLIISNVLRSRGQGLLGVCRDFIVIAYPIYGPSSQVGNPNIEVYFTIIFLPSTNRHPDFLIKF